MKTIATALGLSAEASEDQILAEVTKLKNRAADAEKANEPLKNRVTELEGTNKNLLDAQVENDLEKYANRFPKEKREDWKKALLANRAQAVALLDGLEERKTDSALLNRADAKTPLVNLQVNEKATKRLEEVKAYKNRVGCSFESAWEAIKLQKPELFD